MTRSVRLCSRRPSPWHVWQRRLDDLALAVAARAGADVDHLAEHRLANGPDLAAAVALRAGDRLGAGLGAGAVAGLAGLERGELDLLLGAIDRLLEGDPQVVAQVRTGLGPAAPGRRGTRSPAEEGIEDVREAAEALEPGAARPTGTVGARPPEGVVARPSIRVGQDLVGLVDLLELFLRGRIGVDVGVPLLGQLAEGALDLGVGRGPLDAEDHVVVAFSGGHRDARIREVSRHGRRLPSRDGRSPAHRRTDHRPRRDLGRGPARRPAGQGQPRRSSARASASSGSSRCWRAARSRPRSSSRATR